MGVRENKIERYLDDQVKSLGGLTRKWVSPGHRGVPDRIVVCGGVIWLVEVKTPAALKNRGRDLSSQQTREIKRLRDAGALVSTVCSEAQVDMLIECLQNRMAQLVNPNSALSEAFDLSCDAESGPWFQQHQEQQS